MDGPAVPAGEVYCAHEAPNGELGFYLVSTGGGTPYKVHVRSPSFVHMGGGAAGCSTATSSPTSSRPSARST